MNHKAIVRNLQRWFAKNARDLPWRRTRDPYAIWVSEIMLQQTQVRTVIPYWERWMRHLPTIQALAKVESKKLHKLWEGLGYYTRVRNMHAAARIIVSRHGSGFPREFDEILELPGIGRYTAGAICSIAFNQPHPVLDGNVIRVLTRFFGIEGNPRESQTNAMLWRLAEDLVRTAIASPSPLKTIEEVPAQKEPPIARSKPTSARKKGANLGQFSASNLNQALMELGALVCTSRHPRCLVCPIARLCVARSEDRINDLPAIGPRIQTTRRRFVAFVLERRGRFFVRRRPKGVVNAFLWEFPNVELTPGDPDFHKAARKELGVLPVLHPFCSIRHTITRFRITLEVYRASLGNGTAPRIPCDARWLTLTDLERLPFASAHKKVLLRLRSRQPNPPEGNCNTPIRRIRPVSLKRSPL